jgi:hypothetical protein
MRIVGDLIALGKELPGRAERRLSAQSRTACRKHIELSAPSGAEASASGGHSFRKIFDSCLGTTLTVRQAEPRKTHLDYTQRPQNLRKPWFSL